MTGLALGLTGGGGSIFAVPLLTFVLGMTITQATALSLTAVAITAGIGATRGLLKKIASVKAALPMLAAGLIASPLGVFSSRQVAEEQRLWLFAMLMLCISLKMLLSKSIAPRVSIFIRDHLLPQNLPKNPFVSSTIRLVKKPISVLFFSGLITGFLSGFFGVGGGFLIVPMLVTATSLNMHQIIATSMLIITGVSLIGVSSFWFNPVEIPLTLAVLFIVGNIFGLMAGIGLGSKLSSQKLQIIFAVAIGLVGFYTLMNRGG